MATDDAAGNVGLKVRYSVSLVTRERRRRLVTDCRDEEAQPQWKVPRVSRLLSLAHHIEDQLDSGELSSLAGAARNLGITRPRLTQIMDLLHLAPDIQEEILLLPPGPERRLTERALRPVVAEPCFDRQRRLWAEIRPGRPGRQPKS